ncbi:MAG TPA: CHAT domain-containing protein [Thermoanaerobaculia bacterium]|nr:CHAT domain-containing protein [Thermoanaerobaculia bacterium]
MSEQHGTTPCPDAETLALFVEGKLKRHEIAAVTAHLETCAICTRAVRGANAELAPPRTRAPWLLAAAAVLAALVAVPALLYFRKVGVDPSLRTVIELSPRSARVLEPRLSGGFPYAPWRGPNRSGAAPTDSRQLKLFGAAGELIERAAKAPTPQAQHDAGIALTVIGKPLEAAGHFRDAAARGASARVWSDLAAAQYAAALQLGRPSLFPEALASADRALQADPRLPEALFNRALILERIGLTGQAREAWQRYLAVDAASPWAAEARQHLTKLPVHTGNAAFRSMLPAFEQAVAARDAGRVRDIVAAYPQQARQFAEAEYLGQWGEAHLRGDAVAASRLLAIARETGTALVRLNGEGLLRDAVGAIDRARDPRPLAEAHAVYRRGRIRYASRQPSKAEPDLRRAAALFSGAGSPMSLVALNYAASTRWERHEVDATEREVTALLAEAGRHRAYIALDAQLRWQLALCRMVKDDWTSALTLVQSAAATFRDLGERSNRGFVETLVADALMCLARPDDAWTSRIESFRTLSAEGNGDRLPVSLGGAARMELRVRRLESASAILRLEEAADRALKDDVLLTNALVREAVLASVLGDDDAAAVHAREATAVARRIEDPPLRVRALTDAGFAMGAILLRRDPRGAEQFLTRAIDGYTRMEKPVFLPETRLLRARARLQTGDRVAAAEDLEQGIRELERHRIAYAGTVEGTGIFDAGRALFAEATALALQRGDDAGAFAYVERSRAHVAGTPATASEIMRRLRGSRAAVLEVVALGDDTVLTFCITESALAAGRAAFARKDLDDPSRAARARLYGAIVRPTEKLLAGARRLVVVSEPPFDGLPFAALYDDASGAYLVQRMPLSMALSASSLQSRPSAPPREVVTVALPSGESAGTVALPRTASELSDVRSLYPRAAENGTAPASLDELAAAASAGGVVHIAGHTQQRSASEDAGLRFADRQWASWRSIAASRFPPASTVVLAACETLRRPAPAPSFALSLGDAFLAAGAGDVIGTLDAIADDDAYDLFLAIHRQLAAGARADEAVRAVQLQAMKAGGNAHWQAVAVLTRHIPDSRSPD